MIKLKKRFPAVMLLYVPITIHDLQANLDRGAIDLAVILQSGDFVPETNNSFLLSRDRLAYVSVYDKTLESTKDFAALINSQPLYYPEHQTCRSSIITGLMGKSGLNPDIRYHDSPETAALLTASGEGGTVMPEFIPKACGSVRHFPLNDPSAEIFTYAVWLQTNMNSMIQEAVNLLQEQLHEAADQTD